MRKVTTVCGDIPADRLGFCSTHEHIVHDFTRAIQRIREATMPADFPVEKLELVPRNFHFLIRGCNNLYSEEAYLANDLDVAAFEVEQYKLLGGQSIVDAGGLDIRGDVEVMRELSKATGVHVVCSTGLYQYVAWPDELLDKDAPYLTELFLEEIEEGIADTGIRPGAIKAALGSTASGSADTYEREMTNIRAGATAAVKSGLPLMVHTAHSGVTTEDEVLKAIDVVLGECGLNPDKLYMCHMDTWLARGFNVKDYVTGKIDRSLHFDLIHNVLATGANIGFDTWGSPFIVPGQMKADRDDRLRGLYRLIQEGYQDKIVLGNDFLNPRIIGVQVGGDGMTNAAEYAVPVLRDLGLGEAVEAITVKNPARIFGHD